MVALRNSDGELRVRVFDAALPLLQEEGYFRLTLEVLAGRMGVAAEELERLFPGGREQLICEAMDYWAPAALGGLSAALEGAPDTASGLEAIFTFGRKSMHESNNINICPIAILALGNALSSPRVQATCSNGIQMMANIFRKRLVEDEIPPEKLKDLALLLTTVFEGCFVSARALNDASVLTAVGNQLAELIRAYVRECKGKLNAER